MVVKFSGVVPVRRHPRRVRLTSSASTETSANADSRTPSPTTRGPSASATENSPDLLFYHLRLRRFIVFD